MTLMSSHFITRFAEPPSSLARPARAFAVDQVERDAWREAWDALIDTQLVEWGRNPDAVADSDCTPPTREAVSMACALARELREAAFLPAMDAVPDGDGGIVLDRFKGNTGICFQIDNHGEVEFYRMSKGRIVDRVRFAG